MRVRQKHMLSGMPMTILRRLLSILILTVYVGGTIVPATSMAYAADAAMPTMMAGHADHGAPMPCKGKLAGCVTEIGCIVLVSLPAPYVAVSTSIVWSPVIYSVSLDPLHGLTIPPTLGPPISRA